MADSKKYDGSQWEHSLRKLTTATEAVENPLYSDGTAITSYTIKGNEEHTGTPSPQNPVMPQGVGNKTANLFDYTYYDNTNLGGSGDSWFVNNNTAVVRIPCKSSTTYTIKFFVPESTVGNVFRVALCNSNNVPENNNPVPVTVIDRLSTGYNPYTLTTSSDTKYILLQVGIGAYLNILSTTMIVEGSTAPSSYEPSGYKIPILSNGAALSPMYLSEQLMKKNDYVDSLASSGTVTRKIKKLVLTGEENWLTYQSGALTVYNLQNITDYLRVSDNICMCTHYPTNDNVSGAVDAQYGISFINSVSVSRLYLRDDNIASVNALKQYLADQYAAGTPVTIWYVLAAPTTEQVTVPTIPTTEGANSITVDTTVQPSEFTATWSGWHNANVKEWDDSQWN